MDAEVGAWWRRGGGTGGHGLDYTAWGGSGEKDNAEAPSALSRREQEGENRSLALLGMTGSVMTQFPVREHRKIWAKATTKSRRYNKIRGSRNLDCEIKPPKPTP